MLQCYFLYFILLTIALQSFLIVFEKYIIHIKIQKKSIKVHIISNYVSSDYKWCHYTLGYTFLTYLSDSTYTQESVSLHFYKMQFYFVFTALNKIYKFKLCQCIKFSVNMNTHFTRNEWVVLKMERFSNITERHIAIKVTKCCFEYNAWFNSKHIFDTSNWLFSFHNIFPFNFKKNENDKKWTGKLRSAFKNINF